MSLIEKSIKDLGWNISEEEYHANERLSYSQVASYTRGGFEALAKIDERKESPSLLFGSIVDTMLTESKDVFDARYYVVEELQVEPSVEAIVRLLASSSECKVLEEVPDGEVLDAININAYQPRWKDPTRIDSIRTKGSMLFKVLKESAGKTIISKEMYLDAAECAEEFLTSPATSHLFKGNPFEGVELVHQLKLYGEYNGIPIRCMLDIVKVDHKNKIIYPTDIKTSKNPEYRFYESFLTWNYYMQAGMYTYILEQCIAKDEYFKDFKVADFTFAAINRESKKPLRWVWKHSHAMVDITIGSAKLPCWANKLTELSYYRTICPDFPVGISQADDNNIEDWIKSEYPEE